MKRKRKNGFSMLYAPGLKYFYKLEVIACSPSSKKSNQERKIGA